jgi:hypothetical protein
MEILVLHQYLDTLFPHQMNSYLFNSVKRAHILSTPTVFYVMLHVLNVQVELIKIVKDALLDLHYMIQHVLLPVVLATLP